MRLNQVLHQGQPADAAALITEAGPMTYGELRRAVRDLAARLAHEGVAAGDKVALTVPNIAAWPVAMMALNQLGAIVMPFNPSVGADERARMMTLAAPRFELKGGGDAASLELVPLNRNAAPESELADVAIVIFTSGSTGVPKGVMLTDRALLVNAASVVEYLHLTSSDRTLIFLPLSYAYPLSQLLTTWMAGGSVVLMKNLMFPAVAIEMIDRHGVTGFGGVPTSLTILANQPKKPRTALRYVLSAGGPLSPALVQKIGGAFPGAAVFNNYGCTEIAPRATALNYAEHPDRIGSIGRAIANVQVRLVREDLTEAAANETAEIVLSGPTLMKGYYRDPEGTARKMSAHGFHTGDMGYADADGFLYHEGRRDDIFKSGGMKVSAREIEDVLLQHPDVDDAAVVSEPDDLLGAVPVAYVSGTLSQVSAEALKVHCRRNLSAHKVPKAVHVLDRLQRAPNGKLQKFRLAEALR